jgi:hypothetical protein
LPDKSLSLRAVLGLVKKTVFASVRTSQTKGRCWWRRVLVAKPSTTVVNKKHECHFSQSDGIMERRAEDLLERHGEVDDA